jgi:DHA2 family multidrug resistance protein-like MFS transporter
MSAPPAPRILVNMGETAKNPLSGWAGRKSWIGLAVLLLPMMLVMLDMSVIFLALPYITADLSASSTEILWIADIYGFLGAGFLVTMGRLGDRIGRRRLLLIGALAFTVLSVVAAWTTDPMLLIVVRALLGISGATIGPCVMALIKDLFPDPKKMATAFSLLATAAMTGVLAGPAVGGLLLNSFWWGSTFLIAVPVMVLLLVVGPFVLPESRDPSAHRLDLRSVALSLAAVLPVIYGLKTFARDFGLSSVLTIAIGVAFGVAFVRRQRRLADPLLDMRLFGVRAIGATLLMYMLVGIVQSGNGLVLTQHLQLVEGYSPFVTALWMMLPVAMAIVGVHISTMFAKRVRPATVLICGLLVAAAGTVVLTRMDAVGGLVTLLVGLCIVMLGTSPVGTLANQLIMHAAPPERSGSAGSLGATGGELGSALGIAVFGSLTTAFYAGNVLVPSTVPSASTTAANETISQAVAEAEQLPPAAAEGLLTAARATFNDAVTSIAGICVVLFLALAVLVYGTLRTLRPIGAEEQEQQAEKDDKPAEPAEVD